MRRRTTAAFAMVRRGAVGAALLLVAPVIGTSASCMLAEGLDHPWHLHCDAPQVLCAGACTDTSVDVHNCGGCGQACAPHQLCSSGGCVPCTVCGPVCVDTQTDDSNCGGCGNVCQGGKQCMGGTCVCPSAVPTFCGTCVDTLTNDDDCGGCGNICQGGQHCTSGACMCPSAAPTLCGTCVDTLTNDNNCGGCGKVCPPAASTCCNGTCVDTLTDDANCGMCNKTCQPMQHCITDGWEVDKCQGGVCKPIDTSCGAYRCDQSTSTCHTYCLNAAGWCYTGYTCSAPSSPPGQHGQCLGNSGTPCFTGPECTSGLCINNHCG